MLKAFYSSATGMRAQELLIDNTANNLANVNTTAFKRSHINFADLMYEIQRAPG
ncbi:MAG: flagellar basal body protein, partial [Planctomycetota bacterium]